MLFNDRRRNWILGNLAFTTLLLGCTEHIPEAYRFAQQNQVFANGRELNTTVDLLWVVDNSASMDVAQDKLRQGFGDFARKYLKPSWDIRIGVITTDAYLANPAFSTYLNTTISGSSSWYSSYIDGLGASFQNPAWNPSLTDGNGNFTGGVKYGELVPVWGSDYARLLPGVHDGPITGLCFEKMPFFFKGVTDCKKRDSGGNSGATGCLSPNAGNGETGLNQCVNTVQNDTVRSGKAILRTRNDGSMSDSAWTQELIDNFMVNATTGSVGHGSERGLSSIIQFLDDNESSATAFFRRGSIRGIMIVSDEDDQSMEIPASPPAGYTPSSNYACDQAGLVSMNPAANISGANGYCCSTPGCLYGDAGTTCDSKTVDGHTYTPSVCAKSSELIPVATIKSQIDSFFQNLDQEGDGSNPNYFVASIVATNWDSINALQTDRDTNDQAVGTLQTIAADRGDRYIELANSVPGSLTLDISSSNYGLILDRIGQAIIEKLGTFYLDRAPTTKEEMYVAILESDGTQVVIPSDLYEIRGKSIVITNVDFILGLSPSDRILINYQPRSGR